jgi:hypothetical protein
LNLIKLRGMAGGLKKVQENVKIILVLEYIKDVVSHIE